jgi:flavin-dependent dehydrogenase
MAEVGRLTSPRRLIVYDAIVIGARCAGSPTAMLLARKGYRVLLVDRAAFPSDIARLHFIRQPGVASLKRWGLLDQVAASTSPPILAMTVDYGDFPLRGSPTPSAGVAEAYGPRRIVLDKILVDAAVEAGAELWEGFAVQEILVEDGRVTGIRGRARGREASTERARIIVGADGMHSLVARTVDAPVYNAQPAVACYYASYWSGIAVAELEVYWRDRRLILAFPTNDNLVCVAIAWQHRRFHEVRADIEGNVLATIDLAPALAERVRRGTREEPFIGTADLPSFFRRPYGPGWALVGDAGYHKDPYLAHGISDAFRDAELLVEAIDAGFSGRQPLDEALAGYERRRNEAVMPIYRLNSHLAELEPPSPDTLQLRAALRGNQEDTDRYFGVSAGTVSVQEFFSRENIQRIMQASQAPLRVHR